MAQRFSVTPPTVFQWLSGVRDVPWSRLKQLADSQGISWDWLIEGKEPKKRRSRKSAAVAPLDQHAINQRFLSLFSDLTQNQLANLLGVSHVSVYRWRHDLRPVPWEKLKYAVDNKTVSWEWLLEGRET
ncbi:MAG: hypothetical protein LIP23_04125 [Planctomycetes bacterium]|nr:hypothetical protein [Planctomycetota bacterium]